jgi:hypothetical protein
MAELTPLEATNDKVALSLDGLDILIKLIIVGASDEKKVSISSLVFKSRESIDLAKVYSLEELGQYGMKLFDYVVAKNLVKNGKTVKYMIDPNMDMISEQEYSDAIIYAYFMILTRNQVTLKDDENMPKFIRKLVGDKVTSKDLINVLTLNDIDKMDKEWIKKIEISGLGESFRNRIYNGISGYRMINAFKDYEFKKDADPKSLEVALMIREVSLRGPCWEMHPAFILDNHKALNISRCLNNLLIDVYDTDTLKIMESSKMIFVKPTYNRRFLSYKTWNSLTFDFLITPLFPPKSNV